MRTILSLVFVFVQLASALKFDLVATSGHGKNERCIRNFVAKDQLVVVTAIVGGTKGDGQKVNIHVCLTLVSLWCCVGFGRIGLYWIIGLDCIMANVFLSL
jgi:hypothetical protein